MYFSKLRTTLLLVGLCVSVSNAAPRVAARLTLEDLLSVEPIGQTALSPDGKTFAFVRDGQIVLMPSSGGWPVTLTSTAFGKTGLSWSPDGSAIAFAGGGSIWSVSVSGGAPKRLTSAAAGSGDPRTAGDRDPQWSPKGKWILYETGRRGHNSLMVVRGDGLATNFLSDSSADQGSAAWSPDGTQISYVERTPEYFSGKLAVVKFNPESGEASSDPRILYTAPTDRGGGWSLRDPQWSPDGRSLALVLQTSGWDNVYLLPVAGGEPKAVTHGEWEDLSPKFSPDGKSIAITSSRGNLEAHSIWIVPANGAEPRKLARIQDAGVESDPEWSPDGKRIYFHRSSPVPETVHYKSKDGLAISGILYKPANLKAGERHPAVLWIHGGPEGQDSYRLDVWAQYLTQAGYVVLEPNYRGSTGYGEKFRNLNVEDSGGGEMDDVAAGAQYLVDQGLADPKRLAIGGGSHGGTMVGYAVTKYPDLFAAAIELFGVVDRATFLERTNRPSAVRWAMKMGGSPAEKPEVYRKADILLDVDKIKTPLLVMHGENDPQVPPYESVQFTRALKQHGKTYYYFTYPGELHGFSQREHRLDAWRKQLVFLEKYTQPKYGLSSTSTDDLLLETPKPNGK
jgi:dipeptidyl aminopeptidase/acylaminoacyl peptidase